MKITFEHLDWLTTDSCEQFNSGDIEKIVLDFCENLVYIHCEDNCFVFPFTEYSYGGHIMSYHELVTMMPYTDLNIDLISLMIFDNGKVSINNLTSMYDDDDFIVRCKQYVRLYRVIQGFRKDEETPSVTKYEFRNKVKDNLVSSKYLDNLMRKYHLQRIVMFEDIPQQDIEDNYLIDKYSYQTIMQDLYQ